MDDSVHGSLRVEFDNISDKDDDDDLEEGEIVDEEEGEDFSLSDSSMDEKSLNLIRSHESSNPAQSFSTLSLTEFVSQWQDDLDHSRPSSASPLLSSTSLFDHHWNKNQRDSASTSSNTINKSDKKDRPTGDVVIYDDCGRRKIKSSETTAIESRPLKERRILKPQLQRKRSRSTSIGSSSDSSESSDCSCSFCSCSASHFSSSSSCSSATFSKLVFKESHNKPSRRKDLPIQIEESGCERAKSGHDGGSKFRNKSKSSPKKSKEKRVSSPSTLRKPKDCNTKVKSIPPSGTAGCPRTSVPLRYRLEELRVVENTENRTSEKENVPHMILPGNTKPVPGSLGEMLLKKQLKGKIKCHLRDKPVFDISRATTQSNVKKDANKVDLIPTPTKAAPPLVVLSDDEDELTLRYLALQSTCRAVDPNSVSFTSREKHYAELKARKVAHEGSFSEMKFPSKEQMIRTFNLPQRGEKAEHLPTLDDHSDEDILYDPTEEDLDPINEHLPHRSDVVAKDLVDMDISSNNSENTEDEVIIDETELHQSISNKPSSSTNSIKEAFDSNSESQFPVEWAYMMPPPPPPDEPDNNFSSINKWCYDQNMFAQAIESSFEDVKMDQECPKTIQSDGSQTNIENNSSRLDHSNICESTISKIGKGMMCSCLATPQVNTQNLNDIHAEHYKAFMTFLQRSSSLPKKDPVKDACQRCWSFDTLSRLHISLHETTNQNSLIDVPFHSENNLSPMKEINSLVPQGRVTNNTSDVEWPSSALANVSSGSKNESNTGSKKGCLDDEDEDLLLAQLLIDQTERDRAKRTCLKNVDRSSRDSPKHGASKKISKISLPRSKLSQKLDKKQTKGWQSKRSLELGRSNRLDTRGSSLNRDSFPYSHESICTRFPPVKPVIISMNNDTDSDDDFSAVSVQPHRPAVEGNSIIYGINELIKNARNTSFPSTSDLKVSQDISQVEDSAGQTLTPKALLLLSQSKQQKYRKLKEEINLKNKQLEKQKFNILQRNSPVVSSDFDSDHSQPSTEGKASADDQGHAHSLENKVNCSPSPLCNASDDEDEASLRSLLLKSLTVRQEKESPPNSLTKNDDRARSPDTPPTDGLPHPKEMPLSEDSLAATSDASIALKQKTDDSHTIEVNNLLPDKGNDIGTNRNDMPLNQSNRLSDKLKNNTQKASRTPPPIANVSAAQAQKLIEDNPLRKESTNTNVKNLKILKKTEDELCKKRTASNSISSELVSAVSEAESEVEEYNAMNSQIAQFKSRIALLNNRLLGKALNIIKKVESIGSLHIKLTESKESIKRWEAIVREFGRKAVGPEYMVSRIQGSESGSTESTLKAKISSLLKNAKPILLKKSPSSKEAMPVTPKRTTKKTVIKNSANIKVAPYVKPSIIDFKSSNVPFTAKKPKAQFNSKNSTASFSAQPRMDKKSFKVDNRLKNQNLHLEKKIEVIHHFTPRLVQKQVSATTKLPPKISEIATKTKTSIAAPSMLAERNYSPKIRQISLPKKQERSPPSDMGILCPYDLLGRCNDDLCIYQHLENTSSKIKLSNQNPLTSSGSSSPKPRNTGETPKMNEDPISMKQSMSSIETAQFGPQDSEKLPCIESRHVASSTILFEPANSEGKDPSKNDASPLSNVLNEIGEYSTSPSADNEISPSKSSVVTTQSLNEQNSMSNSPRCSSDAALEGDNGIYPHTNLSFVDSTQDTSRTNKSLERVGSSPNAELNACLLEQIRIDDLSENINFNVGAVDPKSITSSIKIIAPQKSNELTISSVCDFDSGVKIIETSKELIAEPTVVSAKGQIDSISNNSNFKAPRKRSLSDFHSSQADLTGISEYKSVKKLRSSNIMVADKDYSAMEVIEGACPSEGISSDSKISSTSQMPKKNVPENYSSTVCDNTELNNNQNTCSLQEITSINSLDKENALATKLFISPEDREATSPNCSSQLMAATPYSPIPNEIQANVGEVSTLLDFKKLSDWKVAEVQNLSTRVHGEVGLMKDSSIAADQHPTKKKLDEQDKQETLRGMSTGINSSLAPCLINRQNDDVEIMQCLNRPEIPCIEVEDDEPYWKKNTRQKRGDRISQTVSKVSAKQKRGRNFHAAIIRKDASLESETKNNRPLKSETNVNSPSESETREGKSLETDAKDDVSIESSSRKARVFKPETIKEENSNKVCSLESRIKNDDLHFELAKSKDIKQEKQDASDCTECQDNLCSNDSAECKAIKQEVFNLVKTENKQGCQSTLDLVSINPFKQDDYIKDEKQDKLDSTPRKGIHECKKSSGPSTGKLVNQQTPTTSITDDVPAISDQSPQELSDYQEGALITINDPCSSSDTIIFDKYSYTQRKNNNLPLTYKVSVVLERLSPAAIKKHTAPKLTPPPPDARLSPRTSASRAKNSSWRGGASAADLQELLKRRSPSTRRRNS